MRINGEWVQCDDGVMRPCLQAVIRLNENDWIEFPLLLDAGADRTVLNAQLLEVLQPLASTPSAEDVQLAGIGGSAVTTTVDVIIWLKRDTGDYVKIRGPFSAFTELASSDISILGRDVTNNFRVIYDYLDQTVMLLAPPHRYEIKTA